MECPVVVDCYEIEVNDGKKTSASPRKSEVAARTLGSGVRRYTRRQCHALITGLQAGVVFQVRVRAHNLCGWGDFSAWTPFHTAGDCHCLQRLLGSVVLLT